MFGRKVKQDVHQLQRSKRVPAPPTGIELHLDGGIDSYLEKAEKLGIDSPPIKDARLKRAIKKAKLLIYPYETVAAFLDKVTPKNRVWRWYTLREIDRETLMDFPRIYTYMDREIKCRLSKGVYHREIPFHALNKVDILLSTYEKPTELLFFISEYDVPHPDPFLAVTAIGASTVFVIDHWDEPGFKIEG
jgi:hypothetical protein